MKRTRRKEPLMSIKEILNKNGVAYDDTVPSEFIDIITSGGDTVKVGRDFNLFEKCFREYFDISLKIDSSNTDRISRENSYKNEKMYTNLTGQTQSISCKVDYSYNKTTNCLNSNLISLKIAA